MKITVKTIQEVEVTTLKVNANVRYWEDAIINGEEDVNGELTPCRDGECWKPEINLERGQITNWKEGKTADIHFKVCDAGRYDLLDGLGNTVVRRDGYVPKIMCPGGQGYGDYIIMKIDENGIIEDWKPILDEFDNTEEEDD